MSGRFGELGKSLASAGIRNRIVQISGGQINVLCFHRPTHTCRSLSSRRMVKRQEHATKIYRPIANMHDPVT
jgi:hypothetical protein